MTAVICRKWISLWFLASLSAIATLPQARAQEALPQKAEPGYEALVEAARLIKTSKVLEAATDPSATLMQKRLALEDKPVAQALDLMDAWLSRPVNPEAELDLQSDSFISAMGGVRALARALAVRQYVLLADGHVGEAIEVMRDGLRLGYAIENHSLIGWLVAQAIHQIVIRPFVEHLDQLSVRDCERLYGLVQDWLSAPDLLPDALERERQSAILLLRKATEHEGTGGLEQLFQEMEEGAGGALDEDSQKMLAQVQGLTPQGVQELIATTEASINAAYRQVQLALRTPYWEQKRPLALNPDGAKPGNNLGTQLALTLRPAFEGVVDRHTSQQAMARLLGCHAAIRRYRWEHNRLPATLAELKLGDMAVDPFSGQEFLYKRGTRDYQLESIGPPAYDAGHPVPGQRVPVTLTPDRK